MKRSPLVRTEGAAKTSVKLYRCKAPGCPASFIRLRGFETWCSPECGAAIVAWKNRRSEEKRKADAHREYRAAREAQKTIPQITKEARAAVHEYVRLRDRAAGYGCISCGNPLRWDVRGGAVDAGHFRSVGSAPHLRFDMRNIHAQCVHCNEYLSGNYSGYRVGLIGRIGLEAVEALEADQEPRRLRHDDLRAIRDDYRARVRAMKKEKAE